jgi:hypothetical protein
MSTAFLFPGQGSQSAGIGQPWVDTPSWTIVAEASDAPVTIDHDGVSTQGCPMPADWEPWPGKRKAVLMAGDGRASQVGDRPGTAYGAKPCPSPLRN